MAIAAEREVEHELKVAAAIIASRIMAIGRGK
jgi:hypothetical protein